MENVLQMRKREQASARSEYERQELHRQLLGRVGPSLVAWTRPFRRVAA